MNTVQFKFVDHDISEQEKKILHPKQQSALAAGFDLASASRDDVVINPGQRVLIPTGVAIALQPGYEAQIRSRSGLCVKNGIIVLNAPGTIDADYRGEIKIILANTSNESFVVSFGMRIAQMVIAPVVSPQMVEVKELDESKRSDAGFGSTGLHNVV